MAFPCCFHAFPCRFHPFSCVFLMFSSVFLMFPCQEHALKASKASRGSPCVADEHWRDAADRLAAVCLELHGVEEGRHVGLVSAWRGELWQTMKLPPLPVEATTKGWCCDGVHMVFL